MALKTVQTTLATIQHRRGAEENFDPDQMAAGEWAVSTDSKKVWMCFQPGLVRRMATYEAFEEDMLEVQKILATCQDIQTAVEAFEKLAEQHKNQAEAYSKESQSWAVGGTGTRYGEDTDNSKYWSQQSASSASNAATSASTAISKANAASASELNAANSSASAATSAETATQKANAAETSATSSSTSATSAAASASTATEKAGEASASASDAAISATSADTYAKKSQSYAVGGTGTRPGEDIDNSKYYYEQSKNISQGLSGTLIPMGTVPFSNLPALSTTESGWMYNISDRFTTTSDFMEGAGNIIPAGANVYKTAEGKWDILAGTPVTTVNGQTGNVVLEKDDIGLGNVPNVTTNDQTPTFTQATTRENIASGSKLSVIFGKIMKWYSDLKAVAFSGSYNDLSDKPNAMKNPAALTFTGAVTGSYDGSAAKSVAIPSGTNNLLATVDGTWLDAVQGKVLDDNIGNINPQKQYYQSGNIDNYISGISFIKSHPNGIFGHSDKLRPIVGYWTNVITYKAKDYDQFFQIAYGDLGTAKRYYSHESKTWSDWIAEVKQSQIDQINSDLNILLRANVYSSFGDIPATNHCLKFCIVHYENKADQDAPIKTVGTFWWNVLIFGTANRQTTVAFQVFHNQSKIYFREKHDNTYFGWYILDGT